MKIAAIVLNWNQAALALRAAATVAGQVDRVILVDNGSRPSDRALMANAAAETARYELVQLERNLGYAGGNNAGIARALSLEADAVLVLNSDAELGHDAVARLASRLAAAEHVGAVAPVQTAPASGRVVHAACLLDESTTRVDFSHRGLTLEELPSAPLPTDYVSGAAFLARAAVLRECGAFDERLFCYFEDADWSIRARRAGWALEVVPAAISSHEGGASTPSKVAAFYMARNRLLFARRTLGLSLGRTLLVSAKPAAILAGSLLRHGHPLAALTGPCRGWLSGAVQVLRSTSSDSHGATRPPIQLAAARPSSPARR